MILDRYLEKLGVGSFAELNSEERKTYKTWEESLNGRKLTDEDVADFLKGEIEDCIDKLTSKHLKERDDTFLKMKVEFIRKVQVFLGSPAMEKKMTEQQLQAEL
jgi:predicted RNase H-like nuclease